LGGRVGLVLRVLGGVPGLLGAFDGPLDALPPVGALTAALGDGPVGPDSTISSSWPRDCTTARSVMAFGAGVPLMSSKARRLAIGIRPISTPASIAAVASSGLLRYACGHILVLTTTTAML
jgi:hypothetical protein